MYDFLKMNLVDYLLSNLFRCVIMVPWRVGTHTLPMELSTLSPGLAGERNVIYHMIDLLWILHNSQRHLRMGVKVWRAGSTFSLRLFKWREYAMSYTGLLPPRAKRVIYPLEQNG